MNYFFLPDRQAFKDNLMAYIDKTKSGHGFTPEPIKYPLVASVSEKGELDYTVSPTDGDLRVFYTIDTDKPGLKLARQTKFFMEFHKACNDPHDIEDAQIEVIQKYENYYTSKEISIMLLIYHQEYSM